MTLIEQAPLYQRVEALPASMSVALGKDYCEGLRAMKNWVLEEIRCAEIVEAIPVKYGEWVRSSPFTDTMECSLCGYNIYSEEIETPHCPWCGARLKGKYDNGTDD